MKRADDTFGGIEGRCSARSLGPYRLLHQIGHGGMAEVFAALDPRRRGIHRLVAVKMLREEMTHSAEEVEMFVDEAHIGSQLRHPNLCAVVDHGTDRGLPFMAMEYLCGQSLVELSELVAPSALRSGGAMRTGVIARVLVEAAEGLAALHGACTVDGSPLEAVHRDVSPDNIIVTCTGEVKLCDFGIVKANFREHETAPGKIKGKVAYMAPEAFDGLRVDHRADVWALGVVAWELLSGQRLFRRSSDGATAVAARKGAERAPHEVANDVSCALSQVVMRALASDPADRFATALAFAHALLGAMDEAAARMTRSDLAAWVRSVSRDAGAPERHDCWSALVAASERADPASIPTSRSVGEPPASEASQTRDTVSLGTRLSPVTVGERTTPPPAR